MYPGLILVCVGHEFLARNGIMHRDVSAGNVLLAEIPGSDPAGFITDLDYSSLREKEGAIPSTHRGRLTVSVRSCIQGCNTNLPLREHIISCHYGF